MKSMFMNRNYFLIWSGNLVSMIGDKFYTLVLALWVLEKYDSPFIMGMVLLASSIPAFFIGLFSGVFVDLKNKKYIIVVTDLIRGVLILLIAYLEWVQQLQLWHILLISVIISIGDAFFNPAIKAIIPEVVEEKDFAHANALIELISGISTVMGPLLGGISIGKIGLSGGFLINGISFILSAVFEAYIQIEHKVIYKSQPINYRQQIKEGLSFLKKQPMLINIVLVVGLVHFAVGSFTLIYPFLASWISDATSNLGVLQAALGLGLIIGATGLNIKHLKNRDNKFFLLILSGLGMLYFSIGLFVEIQIKNLAIYVITLVLMGILTANIATFWYLILQLNIPEDLRGRIFSMVSMLADISIPIAFAVTGILLEGINFGNYSMVLGSLFILISYLWRQSFIVKD